MIRVGADGAMAGLGTLSGAVLCSVLTCSQTARLSTVRFAPFAYICLITETSTSVQCLTAIALAQHPCHACLPCMLKRGQQAK